MERTKKLGKNLLIITIGSFLSKILSFLFLPLYTSALTTSEYGIADLITTSVNLLVPFATLVIGEAIMRFSLGKEEEFKKIFSSGVRTCLISTILTVCVALIIANFTVLKDYRIILSISLLVSCTYNILSFFSRGIGAVKNYSISGVINTFCIVTLNIIFLVVVKAGLIGYILSTIIAEIISIIYLLSCKNVRSNLSVRKKHYEKKLAKSMLKYSIPLVPNSISWWISNSSDKYILTIFHGLANNGVYSVSYKVPSILSLIINIFSSAWIISAVDDFGSEESRKFYSDVYNKYISISLIGISLLIFLNKLLATVLFSSKFYGAWMYQPVLIIGVAFHGLAGFLGSIYTSSKNTKMILISTVIGAILNIILNLSLIPKHGAMGAAIATTISYVVVWLIRAINSRKIMKLTVNYSRILISFIIIIVQLCFEYNTKSIVSMKSFVALIIVVLLNFKTILSTILILANAFIKRKKVKCDKKST